MRLIGTAVSGAAALLIASAFAARAADLPEGNPMEGRKLVHVCSACHGSDGIAKQPDAANLAGQDATYLQRQLVAFRSGERKHEVMSVIAAGLTDKQIADAAAYYAAVQIQVVKVPGK